MKNNVLYLIYFLLFITLILVIILIVRKNNNIDRKKNNSDCNILPPLKECVLEGANITDGQKACFKKCRSK